MDTPTDSSVPSTTEERVELNADITPSNDAENGRSRKRTKDAKNDESQRSSSYDEDRIPTQGADSPKADDPNSSETKAEAPTNGRNFKKQSLIKKNSNLQHQETSTDLENYCKWCKTTEKCKKCVKGWKDLAGTLPMQQSNSSDIAVNTLASSADTDKIMKQHSKSKNLLKSKATAQRNGNNDVSSLNHILGDNKYRHKSQHSCSKCGSYCISPHTLKLHTKAVCKQILKYEQSCQVRITGLSDKDIQKYSKFLGNEGIEAYNFRPIQIKEEIPDNLLPEKNSAKSHEMPLMYKCSKCSEPFPNLESFEFHVDRKHPLSSESGINLCKACSTNFSSRYMLEMHQCCGREMNQGDRPNDNPILNRSSENANLVGSIDHANDEGVSAAKKPKHNSLLFMDSDVKPLLSDLQHKKGFSAQNPVQVSSPLNCRDLTSHTDGIEGGMFIPHFRSGNCADAYKCDNSRFKKPALPRSRITVADKMTKKLVFNRGGLFRRLRNSESKTSEDQSGIGAAALPVISSVVSIAAEKSSHCDGTFDSSSQFPSYGHGFHVANGFVCTKCFRMFPKLAKLIEHYAELHGINASDFQIR